MSHKSNIFIVLLLLVLASCQEVVELDLPKGYKRLVVEGMITDQPGPYVVKLTKTRDYSFVYSDTILYEKGAIVTIKDDAGNTESLTEVGPGTYITDTNGIQGVVGHTYTLDIVTQEGKHYQSKPELLQGVPQIDTLYYRLHYDMIDKSGNPGLEGYMEFQDPPDIDNYYLKIQHEFLLNGRLFQTFINADSDKYVKGQKVKEQILSGFNPDIRAESTIQKLELYSLSKSAYDFWNQVLLQTMEVGSPYDPPPAPIMGNVFNTEDPKEYALGFFGASAVSKAEILVRSR